MTEMTDSMIWVPEPSPICEAGSDNAINSNFGLVFIVSRYFSAELVYFFGKFVLNFEEFFIDNITGA